MKQNLSDLMIKLKSVHRRFLELERLQAEKDFEKKLNPFVFVQTLTQDKRFAWLRPLSSMIADLDAILDEAEVTPENKKFMLEEIAKVLALPQIKDRYEFHRMNDPEFTLLHAEFMCALNNLSK